MKNFKNRYLSLILALILMMLPISSLPIGATEVEVAESYEYTIPTEIIPEENIELYGHKERFYKGEESMNEIRLINEDGTVSAYMFDYPVKYIDDDGITKDKSNKLHASKRNNYLYVNDDNDIKTYFPKKITKKPVILEADGFEIEIGIVTDSKYSKKGVVTEDNYVYYENAFGDSTAIRYKPDFNGYKEDIILKDANAPTQYSFEIKCDGLYIVKEGGILKFISEINDVEVFSTDPFYIYDSSENVNEYVDTDYTLKQIGDNKYLVTITLDEDYLNTEGLTYPVYVDPSVQYDCYDSIGMEDAFIYSGKPTTSYGYDNKGYLGYTSTYGIGRYLIRFPSLVTASDIFTANKIISANLYVYNYAYGTKSATAYAYQYDGSTTSWSESSATWNNVGTPTFSGSYAIGSLSYSTSSWQPFDITAIAKTWVNNTTLAQKGLIFKLSNESNANYAKQICAVEDAPLSGGPYLLINYTQIIPDGVYYIQSNENNSWYIDGSVSASGSYAEIGDFDAEKSKYEIKRESDGYYSIKSVYTGNYLQVKDHSSSTGAKITYYGWYTRNGTKWMFNKLSNGSYTISARCGEGKVISIASSGDGLVQQSYTSGTDYCDEWNFISNCNILTSVPASLHSNDDHSCLPCAITHTAAYWCIEKGMTGFNCETAAKQESTGVAVQAAMQSANPNGHRANAYVQMGFDIFSHTENGNTYKLVATQYTSFTWEMIVNEINSGRPVMLGFPEYVSPSSPTPGAHATVCAGYEIVNGVKYVHLSAAHDQTLIRLQFDISDVDTIFIVTLNVT